MPADDRASEIQARVEEKRRAREATKASSQSPTSPQLDVDQDTEVVTCGCGEEYETAVTVIAGHRIRATQCPDCERREKAQMSRHTTYRPSVNERLHEIGVNVRKHGQITMDEFGSSGAPLQARAFVSRVFDAGPYRFVKGLYVSGPTGVGKTQLAVSVIRDLLEHGYRGSIVFDRARALITTIQDRYGTGDVDATSDQRRTAGVWVLDDLGTEKPTPDAFRILEDILDAREGHPTLITSNLSAAEIAAHWSDKDAVGRFRSRIGPQNLDYLKLVGNDRRFAA